MFHTNRAHRWSATILAGSVMVLGLAVVQTPAYATPLPDCTDGSFVTWSYDTDAPQPCVTPGVSGSDRSVSIRVLRMFGGGGGGGMNDPYDEGGDSGRIDFDISVPEATQLDLFVGNGGIASDSNTGGSDNGNGAGGGGSTAIVVNGVPLAEAGGGGGATDHGEGGAGFSGSSPDYLPIGSDGLTDCSGLGGNQDSKGSGGAGGPKSNSCVGAGAPFPYPRQAGGDGWSGDGGDGGAYDGTTGGAGAGGFGWSWGGDGGLGSPDLTHAGGSGGGGGYGDGGGGASDGLAYNDATGSGGGGGSKVRATAADLSTVSFLTRGTGGYEDDGDPGEIRFGAIGPAVVTAAEAPTDVTTTTATTHSTVDANSDVPVSDITIEYSLDPTFETGVASMPGNPSTLPGVIADVPVIGSFTGLQPGTNYYYRVRAYNGQMTTVGAVALFSTPPTITSISPDKGPAAGGTEVTIAGTGFRDDTTVTVGGVDCAPVTIVSNTELTCVTGRHAAANVGVTVTNGGDQPKSATLPSAYTYLPAPVVGGVSPSQGPPTGGTKITITGSNFRAGSTVTVGGVPCAPVTVVKATTLTCTTGKHAAGAADVVVTDSYGQSGTRAGAFTFVEEPTPTPTPTPTKIRLVVKSPSGSDELRVGKMSKVVSGIRANGKVHITAKCTVKGQRVKRICDIKIQKRKGHVYVTPSCNDHVRVHVKIVATKADKRKTWKRHWKVEKKPVVTCSANANG